MSDKAMEEMRTAFEKERENHTICKNTLESVQEMLRDLMKKNESL